MGFFRNIVFGKKKVKDVPVIATASVERAINEVIETGKAESIIKESFKHAKTAVDQLKQILEQQCNAAAKIDSELQLLQKQAENLRTEIPEKDQTKINRAFMSVELQKLKENKDVIKMYRKAGMIMPRTSTSAQAEAIAENLMKAFAKLGTTAQKIVRTTVEPIKKDITTLDSLEVTARAAVENLNTAQGTIETTLRTLREDFDKAAEALEAQAGIANNIRLTARTEANLFAQRVMQKIEDAKERYKKIEELEAQIAITKDADVQARARKQLQEKKDDLKTVLDGLASTKVGLKEEAVKIATEKAKLGL